MTEKKGKQEKKVVAVKKSTAVKGVAKKATKVASAKVKKAIAEPKVEVKTDDKKTIVVKKTATKDLNKKENKVAKVKNSIW